MAKSSGGESSLSRAVRVFEAFDTGVRDLTATEVAERGGMPLSTTHRLLGELVQLGLIERSPNRRYRIGLRLWELAVRTPGALGIRELATPTMRAVHAAVGQHIQLGILQGDEVLYLERLSAPDPVLNFTVVGGRIPFYGTSSGLVLAAFADATTRDRLSRGPFPRYFLAPTPPASEMRRELLKIRTQGYAITVGYINTGATAIAVPIIGAGGTAVAALSAVVPTDASREARVLSALIPAAKVIGLALGRRYVGL